MAKTPQGASAEQLAQLSSSWRGGISAGTTVVRVRATGGVLTGSAHSFRVVEALVLQVGFSNRVARGPVTCLVGGLSDPVFAAATRRIAAIVTQAETVSIPGASHALHFDRPEEFATTIRTAPAAVTSD